MSKNAENKPSFRRYSPKSHATNRPTRGFLDSLGGWIASQSRLVRSVLAGIVALILTGALVLVSYGLLLSLSSDTLAVYLSEHPEILTIIFIVLLVVGLALYWVGWRLLIGFDRGEKVLEPGRAAALWVLSGFLVMVVVIFLAALSVADALSN